MSCSRGLADQILTILRVLLADQRPPAVPLAGVHPAPGVARADHGGEQRLGGGGVVRQTLGQRGVRVRALNEHLQGFHNHGEGPNILC